MWPFKTIDWKRSSAHLLLLSKFIRGSSRDRFLDVDYWDPVLKEPPDKAISRFIKDGMIDRIGLYDRVSNKFKISDLKEFLKIRGLLLSGHKKDLIERLIENDEIGMVKLTEDIQIFKCTERGAEIAHKYLQKEKEEKDAAEHETRILLEKRQFKLALQVVSRYETSREFSRGINMDWEDYANSNHLNELTTIFNGKPAILSGLKDNLLSPLRIAAGMTLLWGNNYPESYLPVGYETGIRFDGITCVGMFISYVNFVRNINGYKSANIKYVEILGSTNPGSCEECLKISGNKYAVNDVPELPYEKCANKYGCRCSIIPVVG